MKLRIVSMSVLVVLCFVQAGTTPAADFPGPDKLTIGYLPVIFHAQVFGALAPASLPWRLELHAASGPHATMIRSLIF